MRILGIDPGFGTLGWAVVEKNQKLIDCGVIKTTSGQPIDKRLLEINRALTALIERYRPDAAALEKLFFSKNIKTGMDVAKTIGAIILTLTLHDIRYQEYTPLQVKQAITGYGRAGKDQMKLMIKNIFRLIEAPTPDDAVDACAIALCHSLHRDVG